VGFGVGVWVGRIITGVEELPLHAAIPIDNTTLKQKLRTNWFFSKFFSPFRARQQQLSEAAETNLKIRKSFFCARCCVSYKIVRGCLSGAFLPIYRSKRPGAGSVTQKIWERNPKYWSGMN
jgi:hypothetical protein